MSSLEWSMSHAVFVPEIDDKHREIFESLTALQAALAAGARRDEIGKLIQRLLLQADGHFAHEERLMRAARYGGLRWHKQAHDAARRRVGQFVRRVEKRDVGAGPGLIGYLTAWLDDHTRMADMMLASFLRNHRRGLCKVTFRAGTRPVESCEWGDSRGEKVDLA